MFIFKSKIVILLFSKVSYFDTSNFVRHFFKTKRATFLDVFFLKIDTVKTFKKKVQCKGI